MKKLIYIFVPIIAILVILAAIFFTPSGSNAVIKPLANSYLDKKLKKPKVKIEKLDSKYKYIDIDAKIDNGVKVSAKGDVDYFNKSFDLSYKLKANKVKVENKELAVKMDVAGQAAGKVNNFGVNGSGKAFESDLNYKFIIKNKKPESIEANINSAKVAQMFVLASQTPIIDGLAFINIKMPSLNINNPSGKADIEIRDGRFNRGLIAKKFNIILPKDENFKAKFSANVANKHIVGNGVIDSKSAKLNITKVTTTLDFLISKGFFNLNIPKLSRLNKITKQNLRGKLNLNGAFYLNSKKDITQVKAVTKSFGGEFKTFYSNNTLKVDAKKVSIPKIIWTLNLPPYVKQGVTNAQIVVPNLKKLNGQFNISSQGDLNPKMLKVQLPNYSYNMSSKGALKNGTIYAKKSSLFSKFIKIYLSDTKYSLLTRAFTSNFTTDIKELSALNQITGQNIRGPLKVNGKIQQQGANVNLRATTKSLGGIVKLHYKNNTLNANLKNASVSKIVYMLNQAPIFKDGVVNLVVNLTSLTPTNGLFSVASKGSIDTEALQKIYNINLGKLFRYALNVKDATIKKGVINAKAQLDTTIGSVEFSKLLYNINKQSLSAKYSATIDDMSKLEPLLNQKLSGKLDIKGEIKQSPYNLLVTGLAKEFGGSVNFILHNDILTLDAAGVSVVKVVKMLNYPVVLDGISKVHFEYNIKTKKGTYSANLNDARFLNSALVDNLKKYANFDLSKELFSNAIITGNIDNSLVEFNLNTNSQRTKISINRGKIDTKNSTINSKINLEYNGNDYQFKLTGPLSFPHITPVFGGYIKHKILNKAKDAILGDKAKDINVSNISQSIEKAVSKKLDINVSSAKKVIKQKAKKEIKGLFENLLK